MRFVTAGAFLLLVLGLGRGLLALAGRRHWLDGLWLAPVVGLGALPPAMLVLRLLHLPLDYRLLLAIAAIGAVAPLFQRGRHERPAWRQQLPGAGAALVAASLAGVMYAGAVSYPYLEDDDPWQHAAGARYVALHRTSAQPTPPISHYLEPYPPYYTAMMGVLHQTNDDLQWVLKFFNALVVGLSALAAFHAFAALSGDPVHGLVAALILAASPSWMSHFIWSQTLAIPIFLAAVWALLRIDDERPRPFRDGGFWLAVLLVWSATITQPSTAVIAALLLTTLGVAGAVRWRRVSPAALAVVSGGVLSFLTWAGFVAAYGWPRVQDAIGISSGMFGGSSNVDTSGGLVYSFRDIVLATGDSKIDQSTGIGWAVSALAFAGLVLAAVRWRTGRLRRGGVELLMMAWLAIGLVGIEGNAFPVKLFPHRFWVFLALPVAFLAADAAVAARQLVPRPRWRWVPVAAFAALAVGTSVGPRAGVQLAAWSPGVAWKGIDHLVAWATLAERLPRWTRVLPLCSDESLLIGFNLDAEPWDPELVRLKAELDAASGDRVLSFMRRRSYPFLALDDGCRERLGDARMNALWESLLRTGAFRLAGGQGGAVILERL